MENKWVVANSYIVKSSRGLYTDKIYFKVQVLDVTKTSVKLKFEDIEKAERVAIEYCPYVIVEALEDDLGLLLEKGTLDD